MRMMIIEDEQRARRGLKGLLLATAEEQDEIVAEASNGKDGLELIKTLKPDVVFTDIESQETYTIGYITPGSGGTIQLERGKWYTVEGDGKLTVRPVNVRIE